MAAFDRDDILDATDLAALATEKCGAPRGTGHRARWHCPNPAHPDEHPSMGVYQNGRGQWRWKCLACGEGGTAIDLFMITENCTVREALRRLADRAGIRRAMHSPAGGRTVRTGREISAGRATSIAQQAEPTAGDQRHTTPASEPPGPDRTIDVDPAVAALAATAQELLWRPIGSGARRYLHSRGFTDEILAANGIGFDPGPNQLHRPEGLPLSGPGVLFPVRDPVHRRVTYYQVRYLSPHLRRRYDQPTNERARNPRLAYLATVGAPRPGIAVICEGFPDALTAAQNDLTAVALLGTAHAAGTGAPALAARLVEEVPDATFVICFDDDTAEGSDKLDVGQTAAARLADELAQHNRLVINMRPPLGMKDLNSWWQGHPRAVTSALQQVSDEFAVRPPVLSPSPVSIIAPG